MTTTHDSEQSEAEIEQQDDYIFGRTVVNGTEYDAVLDLKSPDGRATYGVGRADALAIAQVIRTGLDNMDVPEQNEERIQRIARSLERTKLLEEVKEEVASEERARGAI